MRSIFESAKRALNEGQIDRAYFLFGVGLHTLQDATSPAHTGFQGWSDHFTLLQQGNHVRKELFYPGSSSNLQLITNTYLDWFQHGNTPLPTTNLFNNIKGDN